MAFRSNRSAVLLGSLRGRFSAPVATLTIVAFLATFAPPRRARAESVEATEPADTPNFADTTNGVKGGADSAASTTAATKSRKAPVGAKGSFTRSVDIQVPPGRLGMTPSLALSYDSSSVAESAVGVGWSLGAPSISRSTRQGFPRVTGVAGARTYDDTAAVFTSPHGELVQASDGPTGVTGVLYAPAREASAVRYEYRADIQDGMFIEHDPSGKKRYYGLDTCLGRTGRITNELGTHAWLLVREEDPHGNSIQYAYHNDTNAARPVRTIAQAMPILARVEWGSNGCTASTNAPFVVSTTLDSVKQAGPINLLDGNTLLSDRVRKIDVLVDNAVKWSYALGYTISETGKALLTSVQRGGDAPETTTFTYSTSAPASGPRFVDMGAIGGAQPMYINDSRWWESLSLFAPQRESAEQAVQAPGFPAGTKFIDIDGNGTTDAIYHAAGTGTTTSHLLWEESSLQAPATTGLGGWVLPTPGDANTEGAMQPNTGLPYFPLFGSWYRGDFATAAMQDLVDLDGDGDPDGVSLATTMKVVAGVGVGFFDPFPPHQEAVPYGQMRFRIFTNGARSGGVEHATEQLVGNWPVSAFIESNVFATRKDKSPTEALRFTPRPESDLQMPVVDVNADGKADVVLLKHRRMTRDWTPGGAVAIPHMTMLRLYQNMDAPDLGEEVQGALDALVKSTVRDEHAIVLVDDDLLRSTSQPDQFARFATTAERLKIVELPGATPMTIMSSFGGIPTPHFPTAGEFVPKNLQDSPWWKIQVDPEGDIYDPLIDLDRAGYAGTAENFFFGGYRFVPRTYLMRGDVARGLISEPSEGASDFETSLQHILNTDSPDECPNVAGCRYPSHANFTSYLADVNGDGLPDLVSAEPPYPMPPPPGSGITGTTPTCVNGHRVHLNRGYGFESTPFETVPSSIASWTPADPTSALQVIANRDRSCAIDRPRIADDAATPKPQFPVAATAQTDINGDGRVDIVVAYQPELTSPNNSTLIQRIFLNTGRGYALAPSSFSLPPDVTIASDKPYPNVSTSAWPRVGLGDQARFVDLDNDGLVDIAIAGRCVRLNLGFNDCTAARWYRNMGTLPDRLERIESVPSTTILGGTGAWTTIEYESPKSSIVHTPDGGFHPPATMRVVKTVKSAAGPQSAPGSDPFAVQEIRLSYDNFVKDVVSNEVLGFEKVTAEFVNFFDTEREHVVVTRIFDVQPEFLGANGSPLPVRHPLKGALLSTVTESGGWTTTELNQYQVEQLGSGVRVRSRRELHGDTSPSQTTAWTAEETTQFDSFGNAIERVTGNFDGESIAPAEQRRRTGFEYENHTDTQWMLGLVTRTQKLGYSVDIDGNVDPDHVLEDVVNTYDSLGSMVSTSRVNITDPACAGPADDVKGLEYWPNGLLKSSRESSGPGGAYARDVSFTYDAKNLYVATAQTTVGKMSGLQFVPATTSLTVTFQTDLRHGKTTRATDPNNAATVSVYDSSGRLLSRTGPDNTVLEQNVYVDTFPLSETSTITTDVGKTFQRRTQLDADGHALSVVEGAGTTAVPWSRKSKVRLDAFGRTVESYLPAFVSTLGGGVAPSTGAKDVTSYDGFDRSVQVTGADGRVTSTAYEPRETTETNARGIVTRRAYDAFGELVSVDRNPGGAARETSSHSFVRDGRGEIVSVTDGDGSVRRIQRDGGGRIRFVTLPTAPGQTPTRFAMCHDVSDKLVHLESPAGRVVDVIHDELGRTLASAATDANGLSIRNTETYDEGVPGGLGRLTQKRDESGAYKFEYDVYGRPSAVTYAASARAKAGATNVPVYGATFVYTRAGALSSVSFTGIPGTNTTPALTYTRDVKGRATTVSSKLGTAVTTLAASVTFDAADRITSARYGNGTSGAWTFNPVSERLDKISYLNSSNAVLASVWYDYDENDNPIWEGRFKQGTLTSEKYHRYDALDRLWTSDAFFPSGNQQEVYGFTPSGNLVTAGGDTYTYASPVTAQAVSLVENATTQKQRALGYDPDGYVESDVETRGDGSSSTRALAFDPFGCMRSITRSDLSSGGTTTSSASDYTCGLDGRVVARSTTKADGTHSRRIDFAGLAEIRPDDGVFMLRVPLQGSVAAEDARSLSTGARVRGLSSYIMSDARGSVLATTYLDVLPATFAREAEYDAWGNKLAGYSTLASPKHGFAGAEPDEAVGTYSFGARSYDPTLRRWVSPDPLLTGRPDIDEAVGPSLNLYAYGDGNPVKNTDKSGFCPLCPAVVPVVAAGATILLMGAGAPSDSKAAPPNLGIVLSAIPGPSVVAMGTGALLKLVAPFAERALPSLAPAIRALAGAEKAVAPAEPALAKAAAPAEAAAAKATPAPATAAEGAGLTPAQASNLKRFEGKLPAAAGETSIHDLPGGGKAFQATVPGKVPGSKAIYEKQVSATGATSQYTKTTVDPAGKVVHVKDKIKGSVVKP